VGVPELVGVLLWGSAGGGISRGPSVQLCPLGVLRLPRSDVEQALGLILSLALWGVLFGGLLLEFWLGLLEAGWDCADAGADYAICRRSAHCRRASRSTGRPASSPGLWLRLPYSLLGYQYFLSHLSTNKIEPMTLLRHFIFLGFRFKATLVLTTS
jgi:hypothetical protein